MRDEDVEARIEQLEAEERELREDEAAARDRPDAEEKLAADRARLEKIRLELDQQWDLLRRRRALRDAGQNPDEAQPRSSGTVEGYLG
jgi:Protein of unknown function (DUF2630)